MRQKLIDAFWYHVRTYMNFPNGNIYANEVIESKLGRGKEDLKKVISQMNYVLKKRGIKKKFYWYEDMTLQQLLNQINEVTK